MARSDSGTLLTTLALRALQQLRPKFIMINYQDPDYVHWGNPSFYTQAISIIDEGVREIYSAVQADPEYRDRTVFVIIPDCGRDNNRCAAVPYQHHFNTASAHDIFAVVAGPVFRDVMTYALQELEIPPTNTKAPKVRVKAAETPSKNDPTVLRDTKSDDVRHR